MVLSEAPVVLAFEIVTGEILYLRDATYEAEYQLYIMRMAAELIPFERAKQKMIMGVWREYKRYQLLLETLLQWIREHKHTTS